jgi:hypothetical protein
MSSIHDEILQYCNANNITDIEGFKDKLLKRAFTIEKYGYKPEMFQGRTNPTIANEIIPVISLSPPVPILDLLINPDINPDKQDIIIKKDKNNLKTDIYDE